MIFLVVGTTVHKWAGDVLYINIAFITKYSITQLYTVQDTTKFTAFWLCTKKVSSAYQNESYLKRQFAVT